MFRFANVKGIILPKEKKSMAVGKVMAIEQMAQKEDLAKSETPSGIYGGILREKTYIKPSQFASYPVGTHPRFLDFPEPFAVAAHKLNLSWNETNTVCMVQFAGCNLRCDYCFIGKSEETQDEAAIGVWNTYWHDYLSTKDKPSPVFRVSGGEPFLQQKFLVGILALFAKCKAVIPELPGWETYRWVDTNLTIEPSQKLLKELANNMVGVCGCFKPSNRPSYGMQFEVAKILIDSGVDTYFYYPCALTEPEKKLAVPETREFAWRDTITEHFLLMRNLLGELSPLRTHPIRIHYEYAAQGFEDKAALDTLAKKKHMVMTDTWRRLLQENYNPKLLWLPDYQIPLKETK